MFEEEMRMEYQKKVKTYLLDRQWYTLVECLEEVTDFWSYGKDFTTQPDYNVFMPTKNHLMNRPDMLDGDNDDLGYRYNLNRLSPAHYLNTLKAYKMSPSAEKMPGPPTAMYKPKFARWRRLSQTKVAGFQTKMPPSFSTINTGSRTGDGMWYHNNFTQTTFGLQQSLDLFRTNASWFLNQQKK